MAPETQASSAENDHYFLQRDDEEMQRLNRQHLFFTRMFGYLIHPSIAEKLDSDAQIADIGTGTGIWVRDVAKDYPPPIRLYGFDISTAQFPDKSQLPSNVTLQLHDAKEAFPIEWNGKFDLVHLRYVTAGITDEDWEVILSNIITILKPGGAVQWTEPDYLTTLVAKAANDGTKPVAHELGWRMMCEASGLLGRKFVGAKQLPEFFSRAGLQDVKTVVANCENDSELADEWNINLIDVTSSILTGLAKNGVPGAPSEEEVKKIQLDALEEHRRGCRSDMDSHMVIGFKNL